MCGFKRCFGFDTPATFNHFSNQSSIVDKKIKKKLKSLPPTNIHFAVKPIIGSICPYNLPLNACHLFIITIIIKDWFLKYVIDHKLKVIYHVYSRDEKNID